MAILERGWRREGIRPGLTNNTEYGAGEFPRPPTGFAAQSTSRPLSMIQSQQTEEAYSDLINLRRELERVQRERDKSNLDRDGAKLERYQAILERDQAILERDQARRYLTMIRAEYQQEQKVRENEANLAAKFRAGKIQRKQREFVRQKKKGTTSTEPAATGSRPESRMEVDEVSRSGGRLNVDRVAQEHRVAQKRGARSVDTTRAGALRAQSRCATNTAIDGGHALEIRRQFKPKQQSNRREFIASQRAA